MRRAWPQFGIDYFSWSRTTSDVSWARVTARVFPSGDQLKFRNVLRSEVAGSDVQANRLRDWHKKCYPRPDRERCRPRIFHPGVKAIGW